MFDTSGVVFADDLDVACDPSAYADAAPPAPIDAGTYGFRIKADSLSLREDKDGKTIMVDGKYPIITIGMIDVVEPAESARSVALYQDFRTKPFPRFDYESGTNVLVNNLGDLIRSADATASFRGVEEGLQVLSSLVAQGAVFYARFDWSATDVDAAKAEVEELKENADDPTSDETRKAINAVWKKYRVRGQKNFKGKPYIVAKDGSNIDARVEIPMDGFISQTMLERVKIGPKGKRKAA